MTLEERVAAFGKEQQALLKKYGLRIELGLFFPKYSGSEIPDLLKVALYTIQLNGGVYDMKLFEEKR